MKDYFKEDIHEDLSKINTESKPLWGGMSALHMIEHLCDVMNVSNGTHFIKDIPAEEKIAKTKMFLMSDMDMPKNVPLPEQYTKKEKLKYETIQEAISELKKDIEKFHNYFKQNPESKPNHPVFGPLNKDEWMRFHNKHFKHHLSQFGIV